MFDFFKKLESQKLIEIKNNFLSEQKQTLFGLNNAGMALLTFACGSGSVFVGKDLVSSSKIAQTLTAFNFNVKFLTSAYENSFGLVDQNLKDDFLGALADFVFGKTDVLMVLAQTLLQKVPSPDDVKNHACVFKTGQLYNFADLPKRLVDMGYERKTDIFARGDFAIKGDVVYIYSINQEHLIRLEFFDDLLEKISLISFQQKRLISKIQEVVVPARNLEPSQKNILAFCTKAFFDEPKQLMGQLDALETGANLLDKEKVFDVVPRQSIAFASIVGNTFFKSEKIYRLQMENGKNYLHSFQEFIQELKSYLGGEKSIYIFCGGKENKKRLEKILEENFVFLENINGTKTNIELLEEVLPSTIHFYDAKAIFFGTYNLFAKQKTMSSKRKKQVFMPKVSDYVVHEVHGVGKCVGLEKLKLSGYEKDYIIIEYLGGDKFYLPSEQADMLSLYSTGQSIPKLNKLGGQDFEKQKEKVYKSVKEMAFDLLKLYAIRSKAKGKIYDKDDYLMEQFEDAFMYDETPDQLRAIQDIKTDMESSKIMDRLVCGDVGFGKTEVALRAIYKAVLSGSQVAFLCPTTILAQQHFKTCQDRFAGFMVKTARFNRLMKKSEETEVLKGLADGSIDVVVGTHKLLSSKVQFKNLTLLVLDEEHRFGVEDKEKIKNLKENVDVLTLSATPIPRTLHMSLTGIRDISIIDTPPQKRQPIQTFVTEFDELLVQKAINQELARGGQVLIIYNNIEKIYDFSAKIKHLAPHATIGVAHGRLTQKVLEDTIIKLYSGEYQILVSTTLIENGIDLPSANTLIVVDADKLGLSQAYQIRGRIGRSDKVAYAYFLIKENKQISETAYKRLSALMENTALGSGMKIAMADLDIRGAGNVLGKQQSGNMVKVGYDLYYKLLDLAMKEVKGEKTQNMREVKVDIPLSAYVPESFVQNQDERLKVISEISQLSTETELDEYLKNMSETIGAVPEEVENLAKIALAKNLAQLLGAKRVVVSQNGYKIYFYEKNDILFEKQATISDNFESVLGYFKKQITQNS